MSIPAIPSTTLAWMAGQSGSNIVQPSGTLQTNGYAGGAVVDAEHLNYILKNLSDWFAYLSAIEARSRTVATETAAYSVTTSDYFLKGDATSGTFAFTLPDATTCAGYEFRFMKIDSSANAVTFTTVSAQTISGNTPTLTEQWAFINIKSDGANWMIIANG